MENNAPKKKQLPAFLILTIIAVVAAVVLALTNMITAGPIAEHAMAALKEAFNAVMPAESYEIMTVPAEHEVSSLYVAKNGDEVVGYCVTASSNGYGGPVAVTLGVDTNGVVTGISVGDANFAETPGFGARAKDASFQEQFPGISAVEGGAFEALSGATITSEAVRAATNKGLKCVAEVALGASQNAQVEFGAPAGKPAEAETVEPVGDVLTAAAPGFAGQDVIVNATMNADGTIATLSFDMSLQAPPVCDLCNTDEFKSQFIGKAGPFVKGEGVDIVSGATFTSEGIIAAVNKLYETEETFAEAPATVIAEGDTAALAVKADGAAVVTPVEGYTGEVAVNLTVENGQVTAGEFAAPAEEAVETTQPAAEELTAAAPGFVGKDVGVAVTLNEDGTIATLTLDLTQQAPPVCDLCNSEDFLNQFIGKKGPFVKGKGVDIVTGATFTSEGVIAALNTLFPEEEKVEEEVAASAVEELTAAAPGFVGKDVGVAVTLNEDGTIATLTLDLTQQAPPVCDLCNGEDFLNQFIGKKGPFVKGEGVDIVTGATFTSEGVIAALNTLFPEEEKVEEVAAPAEEQTAVAPGFLDSEVGVTATLNADGTIATLTFDLSKQVPPACDLCDTEAFKAQFIGKKGPFVTGEGVDVVTGATFTSEGIIEALNKLFQ